MSSPPATSEPPVASAPPPISEPPATCQLPGASAPPMPETSEASAPPLTSEALAASSTAAASAPHTVSSPPQALVPPQEPVPSQEPVSPQAPAPPQDPVPSRASAPPTAAASHKRPLTDPEPSRSRSRPKTAAMDVAPAVAPVPPAAITSSGKAPWERPRTKKFDPLSFERDSRGLMIACRPGTGGENQKTRRVNCIAFSLAPQCVKHLTMNHFEVLKNLQLETGVRFYLYQEEGKPKVLELWSENHLAVSYSADTVRDYLIRRAIADATAAREKSASAAAAEDDDMPRYQVALYMEAQQNLLGPVIGHRGDVQRAIADQAGLDCLDIFKDTSDGLRTIKMAGMPHTVAYAKALIQERLRYRGTELTLETGKRHLETDAMDEELLYSTYKAIWSEYFTEKALTDYATALAGYAQVQFRP